MIYYDEIPSEVFASEASEYVSDMALKEATQLFSIEK